MKTRKKINHVANDYNYCDSIFFYIICIIQIWLTNSIIWAIEIIVESVAHKCVFALPDKFFSVQLFVSLLRK